MTDLSDYNKTRFSLDEGKNGARPTSLARPVCTENLNADVVMMKSAEYRV